MDDKLRSAVRKNDVNALQALVEAGADVNARDEQGRTPLFCAIQKNSLAAAEVLVEAGADVTVRDNYGRSTLDWARSPEMGQLLARAWPQDHPLQLHALAKADLADEVVDAVAAGADVSARDEDGRTPLFCAIQNDSQAAAEVLVEAGADVSARDKWDSTPLFCAIQKNNLAAAEVLIEAGADVTVCDDDGQSTLDLARSPEMRQLLARAWPQDHPLRLHALANVDLVDEVVDAVAAGADVNARDEDGWTPLFWAIPNDSLAVAEVLVEAGADVTDCDNDGRSTLDLARSPEMRQLLIRAWPQDHPLRLHALFKADLADEVVDAVAAGADVNARDEKGQTPLFWASRKNSLAAAKVLVKAGADVNARDEWGHTPLFWASQKNSLAAAEVLVEAGADVTVCDNDGDSTLDLAKSPEMHQLLARAWPKDHLR